MLPSLPFGFIIPHHCRPAKLALAKAFRSAPTPEEARAWEWVRRRAIDGWHFRRQQVVEGFIVDFFCAKLRLVVEVDGGVHDDPKVVKYDEWRDSILSSRGLKIERIRNEVLTEARLGELVRARAIELKLNPPSPDRERGTGGEAVRLQPLPPTSPSRGRGSSSERALTPPFPDRERGTGGEAVR